MVYYDDLSSLYRLLFAGRKMFLLMSGKQKNNPRGYSMRNLLIVVSALMFCQIFAAEITDARNLLLNSEFSFHAFKQHRTGKRGRAVEKYVPYWNACSADSLEVRRDSGIMSGFLPPVPVSNGVKLKPGKSFSQFFTLPEADLTAGSILSFSFWGYQDTSDALKGELRAMKIESEDGSWSPKADFNLKDKRTFQKMSRGELVPAASAAITSKITGKCTIFKIENFVIPANYTAGKKSFSKDNNTVGIEVRFTNTSKNEVWIFSPSLVRGSKAFAAIGTLRKVPEYYRHIPRTMQKLWKGESLHILVMGSSIDRGSANPPLYPYDENPASPKYKQPLSDSHTGFSTAKLYGRSDIDASFGWSNHYFSYAGRLKVELMKKFDLTSDKILMHFMAADGSCVGEAHSGLKAYCELKHPPKAHVNAHKEEAGSWEKLYPGLFSRPEGPRPDLVIFGSGANEPTDTPDEAAVFEGTIRYIQRNYPGTEFLCCMYQSSHGRAGFANMRALAMRYGFPCIDFGIINDRITRNIKYNAIGNSDGHPQASVHYLWFKQIERAFECAGPVVCGIPQIHLPERCMNTTINWEGRMKLYRSDDKRFFRPGAFIIDDAAFNCWAVPVKNSKNAKNGELYVNGIKRDKNRRPSKYNDRNSFSRFGRLALGDRHIIETSTDYKFDSVDCKMVLNRSFIGVESGAFSGISKGEPWKSETGFPYGKFIATLQPGKSCTVNVIGTAFSVVWVDAAKGGKLTASVDGKNAFTVPTDIPFTLVSKEKLYMENRKGITGLHYGEHVITLTAQNAPVKLMGVYSYDTRANRNNERIIRGVSYGGTYEFEAPFKSTPVIRCYGDLKLVKAAADHAVFSGQGRFDAIGE